jgi:hypothetical protein
VRSHIGSHHHEDAVGAVRLLIIPVAAPGNRQTIRLHRGPACFAIRFCRLFNPLHTITGSPTMSSSVGKLEQAIDQPTDWEDVFLYVLNLAVKRREFTSAW